MNIVRAINDPLREADCERYRAPAGTPAQNEVDIDQNIEAIMTADIAPEKLLLRDILDVPALAALLEDFNRITGLGNAIIDMDLQNHQ